MINRVALTGRLTKDIDLKQTQSGTAVTQFTLAVSRQYKAKGQERQADFIECVAWRKTAEVLANYTHKGSLIGVDGRIQTRSYENRDGQRVYVTEVVIDNLSFLDSRNSEQGNQSQPAQNQQAGKNSQQSDPFADSAGGQELTADDFPF